MIRILAGILCLALAAPAADAAESGAATVSLFSNIGKWSSPDTGGDGSQNMVYSQFSYDGEGWGVAATGAWVNTSYKSFGDLERVDITSVTDIATAAYYGIKKEDWSLRIGMDINLPTGKHAYSDSEAAKIIVEDISQDLMLVNVYGSGLNLAPNVLYSRKTGFGAVGAGFKYTIAGEFDPSTQRENDNYDPGDRALMVVTAMVNAAGEDFVLVNASYINSARDKQGGRDAFRNGDQFGLEGRYMARWNESLQTAFVLSHKWQSKNEMLSPDGVIGPETGNANKNSTELFVNGVMRHTAELSFTGVGGAKLVAANGYGADHPLYDAGRTKFYLEPGVAWRFNPKAHLSARFRWATVRDKKDAFSPYDAVYNIYNLDMGVVYRF